jgi:SAM-dependent methyltransferase
MGTRATIRLQAMDPFDARVVRAAYDEVAEDYAEAFADDLDRLPVDRSVLETCLTRLEREGPVLDLGCGPGQVASYLADRGRDAIGLDSSIRMAGIAAARTNAAAPTNAATPTSGARFTCGDMRWLPFRSQSCRAVVAFYSIQHLPRSDLPAALEEAHRVLSADGLLVVATHLGVGDLSIHEFLGHEIEPVGGTLYGDAELRKALDRSFFSVETAWHRDPLPHEHQTQRIYLLARRVER